MLQTATGKEYAIFSVKETELWLLPEKAVFIPSISTLLLADVHLGKASHFQKKGLSVSSQVLEKDLEKLSKLVQKYPIKRIICLGDLFHAEKNKEWDHFAIWLESNRDIDFILIKGNHDRLPFNLYEDAGIKIYQPMLKEFPFIYIHEPFQSDADIPEECFAFAGHIHPATTISGKGKQTIRVESFCFYERQAILPAFGSFTGSYIMCDSENEFVIAGNKVLRTR